MMIEQQKSENPGALAGATGAVPKKNDIVGAGYNALSAESTAKTPPANTPQERWRARNVKAAWAHSATRSAIRLGLIVREPCQVCGAVKADAHHPDYDRPLVVRFLCRKHHKQEHSGGKNGS
ncbi:MAG: hypothetical protein LCH69_10025 [Proteobacteria bacterium]|nr:hypothetical protein [Pseudomonadota bacterium]